MAVAAPVARWRRAWSRRRARRGRVRGPCRTARSAPKMNRNNALSNSMRGLPPERASDCASVKMRSASSSAALRNVARLRCDALRIFASEIALQQSRDPPARPAVAKRRDERAHQHQQVAARFRGRFDGVERGRRIAMQRRVDDARRANSRPLDPKATSNVCAVAVSATGKGRRVVRAWSARRADRRRRDRRLPRALHRRPRCPRRRRFRASSRS